MNWWRKLTTTDRWFVSIWFIVCLGILIATALG